MVGIYQLSNQAIAYGRMQYKEAMKIYHKINHYNEPLYRDTKNDHFIQTVDLPNWVLNKNRSLMEASHV